jgi:hypothetical protein
MNTGLSDLFWSACLAGVLVFGLKSGKLGINGGNFDRTQNPGCFWFSAFFILAVSVFLAIYAIVELRT